MKSDKSNYIVVVGAGVIGLTAALVLKEKGYNVIVVAESLPDPTQGGDSPYYTSNKAGAHFRPFPSKSQSDIRESEYTRKTFEFFKELAKSNPESSIRIIRGYDWIDDPTEGYTQLQRHYTKGMPNFEVLQTTGLPQGVTFACSYDTWVLNAPQYLNFLYHRLRFHYGIKFVRQHLTALRDVYDLLSDLPIAGIINATAVGLQYDGTFDPLCYPIRGQTLLLRVPETCQYLHKTITHQNIEKGLWTFVIPRPLNGGLILGGTKQVRGTDALPIEQDTKDLISRAKIYFPDLFDPADQEGESLDIAKINVGFRPARESGSRVELEVLEDRKGFIIHSYGIGGMGFEASYGMALHALQLVDCALNSTLKPSL